MSRSAFALVALLLAGCAEAPRPQIVCVVSDNYCRLSDPLSWSVSDTTKTIDEVRKSERKRVCLCGKPAPKDCG